MLACGAFSANDTVLELVLAENGRLPTQIQNVSFRATPARQRVPHALQTLVTCEHNGRRVASRDTRMAQCE